MLAKLTDLQKYDLDKVKKLVDLLYKNSKDEAKNAMKAYTSNGYKQISFMVFGDLAAKELS